MSGASLLLLAAGLAMDAMAAAAAQGRVFRLRTALLCAGLFGGFQALMPLLGFLIGSAASAWVHGWEHWLAFVILCGLGGKMLYEARKSEPPTDEADVATLFLLAIATSIDALLVGITLPALHAQLFVTVTAIGVVTAALSFFGVWAGARLRTRVGRKADAFGGLVLIALGTKLLLERL